MLEKLPQSVGHALEGRRAGLEKVLYHSVALQHGSAKITLSSPAFAPGSQLPVQFTSDGIGVSPPLQWSDIPAEATSLVLIVEDPDSPTTEPLVHAIAVDIDPKSHGFEENAFTVESDQTPANLGRNSFLRQGWLPPDPPPGHGVHHYVFQVFALLPGDHFSNSPGRKELATNIRQRAIGSGCLIGTYRREESIKLHDSADDRAIADPLAASNGALLSP
jgi:Raf kinase inhibitor-like YbhB/YbcL family protein